MNFGFLEIMDVEFIFPFVYQFAHVTFFFYVMIRELIFPVLHRTLGFSVIKHMHSIIALL